MTATLRDCVYGQAIGDALGVPFEFRPRDSYECSDMIGYGTHRQPAGTWSDDTSMALAICDSYRELGRIDKDDIRRRFVSWFRDDAYTCDRLFDIGNTTILALKRGTGLSGERDNGNGSLMRTVPLAFTSATDDEIRAVSGITHAHRVSTEACVDMVHAARKLIAGATPRDVAAAYGVDVNKDRSDMRQPCGASPTPRALRSACSWQSTWETTPTRPARWPGRLPASSMVLREYRIHGLRRSEPRT